MSWSRRTFVKGAQLLTSERIRANLPAFGDYYQILDEFRVWLGFGYTFLKSSKILHVMNIKIRSEEMLL